MAQLARTRRQLEKEAIIKVFNDSLQRYETVIIPSGITIGVAAAGFDKGIKLNGPIAFQTTTAPASTSMKLYVVGSTLYFDGSEVGSGGGGAPTGAQYVTLATDSTLTGERVLTAGSNITITDGGAGSTVTIAASAGAGGWTDDGTDVRLTTSTDKVGIGTASPGTKLEIEVAASENMGGLLIDFNETSGYVAFEVDSESTTHYTTWIHGKYGAYIQQDISSGIALKVIRDIAEAGSNPLADFIDDNTSNTQTTVRIQQDGAGDIINLFDGGTEVFTVLDGGNVGIGTDAPSTTLHVEGDAVTIGNGSTGPGEIRLLEDTDLGTYYGGFKAGNLTENTVYVLPTSLPASNKVLQSDSSGVLEWVTDATHDDVGWVGYANEEIITTGSVGIGASASPAERLEVLDADGTATTAQVNNTGGGDPQFSLAVAGTKKCTWGIDNDEGDKFKLGTTACSTGTVLTIDFDYGYAGFGTETPAEALEVETGAAGQTTTTIQVSNTATTGDPQVAFALSGTKKFTMGVDDSDSDKFKIGTTACSTDTMLTIDANGNVGIGTASPATTLHVKDSSPGVRIQREAQTEDGTLDFAGAAGVVGASITHAASTNDVVFSSYNGSTTEEMLRMGDYYSGTNRQVIFLSGSTMHAGAMHPRKSSDIAFFVSGSIGSKDTSTRGSAVFGGDVVISGTLHGGTPLKIDGGMQVTGTMELKPSSGGVAIVRNPHGPVKLFASSALKLGSNIGTIDLLDLGDGAAGQILMKGQGALAERSVELNSPGTLFFTGTVGGAYFKGPMDVDGTIVPGADNAYDLGSSSRRYANIYTGDLHLQNERGHWQIIEERDYLCVVNRLTGKRYKMALEPMDDDE